jgi:hypothetical protein
MVAAEEQLTARGFKYRTYVRLRAAAVTAVQRIQFTSSYCCRHESLLKGVDTSYNHLCAVLLCAQGRLSLYAYHSGAVP